MSQPPPITAFITGASGQDGSYLAKSLLDDGHVVHGLCHSEAGAAALARISGEVHVRVGDVADGHGIHAILDEIRPTHIFNLAGNTSVARSWDFPAETAEVLGVGAVRLLECAWQLQEKTGMPVRFLQASSAEIFGENGQDRQTELTALAPVTPYGAAKSFAHQMVGLYRARGMHASAAILFNHESPRRPPSFVARKISAQVAHIALGLSREIVLGNINVRRDWGFAPDYVDAMVRIIGEPIPRDYIVATGEAHSVQEFVEEAFRYVGINDWERYIKIDPKLYRPADPKSLVGDPKRLRDIGWKPSVDFNSLVHLMVQADLELIREAGFTSK